MKTGSYFFFLSFCFFLFCNSIPGFSAGLPFNTRTILRTKADTNIIIDRTVERYDNRGNLIESARYTSDDVLLEKNIWQYNKDNIRISQSRYDCSAGICYVETYMYDVRGDLREQDRSFAGLPLGGYFYSNIDQRIPDGRAVLTPGGAVSNTYIYKYNKKGLPLQQTLVDCTGETCQIIDYLYDPNDRRVQEKYFDSDSKLQKKVKSSYNAEGRLTETRAYDDAGQLTKRTKFTYDTEGGLLTKQEYDPVTGAPGILTRNTWFGDNLIHTETLNARGEPVSGVEYEYDVWGRISQEIKYFNRLASQAPEKIIHERLIYAYQ